MVLLTESCFRYQTHRSRKSSSKTPDTTLGSSKHSSSKRDSSEHVMYNSNNNMVYSSNKKSSLKNPSQHQMLLNPSGLPTNHNQSHYDESSRVYHITP